MLRNYLVSSLRSLLRNRFQTILNLAGLSIGIASFLIIFRYVSSEESFDTHHKDGDRIYRLLTHIEMNGQNDRAGQNGFAVGPLLQQTYPQLEKYVRVFGTNKQSIWFEDKMFSEETVAYADSTLFDVFNYELIQGDRQALYHPNAIALSEEMAIKYFGSAAEAIGKELKFTTFSTNVLAVFRPVGKSHLHYNLFISIATLPKKFVEERNRDYLWMTGSLYLKLKEGVTPEEFSGQLASFYEGIIDPYCKANDIGSLRYEMQPIQSIHLDNKVVFDQIFHGNPTYLLIFKWVGFFILFIAGVNYMNLTTARSTKRSLEVGIRKVVGALRVHLISQFMIESIIMTFLSFALAILIIQISLQSFNNIAQQHFTLGDFIQNEFLFKALIIISILSIISGLYPAIYLSGFSPVKILKLKGGTKAVGSRSVLTAILNPANVRKGLVLLQFSISVTLIAGTLVVTSQLNYLRDLDMGITKDKIYVIDIPNDTTVSTRLDVIKDELVKYPKIQSVATGSSLPGTKFGKLTFNVDQGSGALIKLINYAFVDENYLETLNVALTEGRNFSRDIASDEKEAFIINEAAVRFLEVKEGVGTKLESGFGNKGYVIGVMKDFNFKSLHNPLEPLVLMLTRKTQGYLMIKLSPNDIQNTLGHINKVWKNFDSTHPYESFFLDDNFGKSYEAESRLLSIFIFFAMLSIFISCLGLLGLSLFAAELRIKEIGIRKVLGSSTFGISALLLKDFVILVGLANFIAWPLAFYYLTDWLAQFAYRIEISWISFLIASLIALAIALATMLFTIIRSVSGSMVSALKYE